MRSLNLVIVVMVFSLLLCLPARAEDDSYSPTLTGPLGLNVIPSARMDEAGTVRLGVSTLDPYMICVIVFQISDPM